MLTHIAIRDLVIVSHLELELTAGMTALTGETGAGKSILIDALGLTLGEKADPSMIRGGCERAEVTAGFDLGRCPEARDWLAEQVLDDGDECVIRRVLAREGRARAFINGRPASGAQLKALGDLLVDIHGQHAHQSLLRPAAQRALLDAYGGQQPQAARVAELHRRWRELDTRFRELTAAREQRAERMDMLRFQVQELTELNLADGELDELDVEQRRLANLGNLQGTTAALLELLYDGEGALRDQLGHAGSELAGLAGIDPRLTETRELVDGATVQVEEAASNLRQYLDDLDMDPGRLAEVEERLARIHDLGRKYRILPEQLMDTLAERAAELAALEQDDQTLGTLEADRAAAFMALLEAARALSEARHAAAARLGDTVTAAMQELGMGGGHFAVAVETGADEQVGASGLDAMAFQVSANPGQPLQPLAKIASGGELSRISLAIQVATAELGRIPTLVFDEVDVGIGGGVAEIVGRLLRRLGDARQVLCVTHLPQVAAQAHQQLKVQKQAIDGQTYTEIAPLANDARVDEIARMLGGTEITATTRAHAAEMLRGAG
ncbi:MAG: DNA repair protein RecN [Thiohalocapsa sp.]|jgi:DNA repair protein RecN (Recombination protein N)|uniref:DNA repair protein RecN n=1 Tax=Thiohalocapsa sp. TaxID=2497641 RepID=UPI0025F87FFB|nr:DNA repair protein RecN [Thiohalocapsa sp.]MCG6942134.1 DNA repair protein RecN [Thiohalocapsa sp.]